ncbi:hypothetical protein CDD81_5002 [Ophiocordyceps australis]|uniref:Letm1 RBD domain-containing protein n=1 Tax=Ophiocordyceps australis TaxID=1399860 RepID=A0A2C5Y606_9HYPO|nr:hypothetical protein CDD81_5002 [Ophiocordyceps australis]
MILRSQTWRQCHGLGNGLGSRFITLRCQATRCNGPRIGAAQLRRLHMSHPLYMEDSGEKSSSVDSSIPSAAANPLVNPPASTRPPRLQSPDSNAFESRPKYYFQLAKAYLGFYKDGFKSVWTNRNLLRSKIARTPADDRPSLMRLDYVPRSFSRADWVLLWRVRHDMLRLPLFGLVLLLFGELTPLVIIVVDGIVPYPCRIPRQIQKGIQRAEVRRHEAFNEMESRFPHGPLSSELTPQVARCHILRSLDLTSRIWDRVGFTPPGMWQVKGNIRMAFLMGDDINLVQDGGVTGLVPYELRIACSERGIDVLGKSCTELRLWLGDWLRLTASSSSQDKRRRMVTLMLTRPENWPQNRNFAVPAWEI